MDIQGVGTKCHMYRCKQNDVSDSNLFHICVHFNTCNKITISKPYKNKINNTTNEKGDTDIILLTKCTYWA